MGKAIMSRDELRGILSREEVRACLTLMAKDACDKFGGLAEVGDGYLLVDTRQHSVPAFAKEVTVCPPFMPAPLPDLNKPVYKKLLKAEAKKAKRKKKYVGI